MAQQARCDVLGCECGCHRAKRRQVPRLWTPGMDRALTESITGGQTVQRIATSLHLTEDSIRWRVKHLGLSTRDGWRSRQEVVAVLGVSRRSVDRWTRTGQLRVTLHGRRWTRVTDADLRAFVERYAGVLFDADGMADAALRRLAEMAAMANRRRAV